MAVVRFSRDKRGYEHLYLIDTSREHGRSRVLYWFRTPPGVKVGRSPFDSDTQRALERQFPDVTFDWAEITAAKPPPVPPVEHWREKRRLERAWKQARAAAVAEPEEPEFSGPPENDEVRDSATADPAAETTAPGRRRRRRRRGNRPTPGVPENGPLDPSAAAPDPSNEGTPPEPDGVA